MVNGREQLSHCYGSFCSSQYWITSGKERINIYYYSIVYIRNLISWRILRDGTILTDRTGTYYPYKSICTRNQDWKLNTIRMWYKNHMYRQLSLLYGVCTINMINAKGTFFYIENYQYSELGLWNIIHDTSCTLYLYYFSINSCIHHSLSIKSLFVRCVFTVCSVCVHHLFSCVCSPFVQCAFTIHLECAHHLFYVCLPFVQCAFTVGSVCVHRLFSVCSLLVQRVFTVCSVCVHRFFSVQSPFIQCAVTACSVCINSHFK
jgi:hypothetical protein